MAAQQWEYTTDKLPLTNTDVIENQLNNYGGEGWELVQVIPDTGKTWVGIYKRPKKPGRVVAGRSLVKP